MDEKQVDALFAGVHYDMQLLKVLGKAEQMVKQEARIPIIDKFESLVANQPKKPFLIYDGLVYTYEAIDSLACKVAVVAKTWNLKSHDCVAIMIKNEPSFVYMFLGKFFNTSVFKSIAATKN